jgi:hypothetical protein
MGQDGTPVDTQSPQWDSMGGAPACQGNLLAIQESTLLDVELLGRWVAYVFTREGAAQNRSVGTGLRGALGRLWLALICR